MTRTLRLTVGALLCSVILLGTGAPSHSQPPPTQNLTVTPSSANINADGSTSVFLTWTLSVGGVGGPVQSPQGLYETPAGNLLGTRTTFFGVPDCLNGCSFNETVTVPASVIEQATAAGYGEVRYRRSFTIGPAQLSTFATLTLQGAPRQIIVNPPRAGVGYGVDTTLPLVWTVLLGPSDGRVSVTSQEGLFLDRRGRPLGGPMTTVLTGRDRNRVIFREDLLIPAATVVAAAQRGPSFSFSRTFAVGAAVLTGEVVLTIEGGIEAVTVLPPRATAQVGRDSTARVRWRIAARTEPVLPRSLRGGTRKAGGLAVDSPRGVFRTESGEILGQGGGRLGATISDSAAEIAETVRVPQAVSDAAVARRQGRIFYTREFSDGFSSAAGRLIIDLTGRIGGEFTIDRLALSFHDGSQVKVAGLNDEVKAEAEITFFGSGLLRGRWLIAEPTSSAGALSFRTLKYVTRHLAGQRRVRIVSPELPTDISGAYAVRFSIERPDVGEATPTIVYQVAPAATALIPMGPRGPTEIRVLAPGRGTELEPGTAFSWEPVPGSIAYQLEVFDGPVLPGAVRLTGQVVPGDVTELSFSSLAGEDLAPGASYWWRVLAFGAGGGVTGASRMMPIRTP